MGASRDSNPIFLYFFNEIRLVISAVATSLQSLLSQPVGDRPLPIIGWLGVVALVGYVSWALGNWRVGAARRRPGSSSWACRGCGSRAWTPWR